MNFLRCGIAFTMLLACFAAKAGQAQPLSLNDAAKSGPSAASAEGAVPKVLHQESRREQILRQIKEENLPVHRAAKMELQTFLPAILVVSACTVIGLLIAAYLKARHPFARPRGRAPAPVPASAPKEASTRLLKESGPA